MTTPNSPNPAGSIDCAACQSDLTDYVEQELAGQDADQAYPDIAWHLETCAHCEAAYYREFRAQGRKKSLAELKAIGDRSPVAGVMDQVVGSYQLEPDPSWVSKLLESGRAWFEEESGRWRQLALSLSGLGKGAQAAPALGGLMGAEAPQAPILDTSVDMPPESGLEVKLVASPDPTDTGETLCRLEVAISIQDRFGDFSGVRVTLQWGETAYPKETDAQGKVLFSGLPRSELMSMNLLIVI